MRPPQKSLQFLRWFCREDYLDEIEGDLIELFEMRSVDNPKKAKRSFVWDVVKSLRMRNVKILNLRSSNMNQIRNYVKIYFRRMRIEATHYAVNILGLALGFSVLLFIMLYVRDEVNIDSYHSKSDRIYRVIENSLEPDEGLKQYAATSNPLAEAMKLEFSEVEESAKYIYMGSMSIRYQDRMFQDRNYIYTTSGLFNILDFEMLKGDPHKEFNGPVGAVLSKSMAAKLFEEQDPVGKVIEIPGKFEQPVEVLAVMEDMPSNSSYQFKMVLVTRFERIDYMKEYWTSWDTRGMTTLVLLADHTSPVDLLNKKEAFLEKYYPEDIRENHDFTFQKFSDIHLNSTHLSAFYSSPLLAIPYSSRNYLNVVTVIGLFVMLIAMLNYINLSSVQALKRMQEAGVRKVNGASNRQLRVQLFTETLLSVLIAYGITLILVVTFFDQFLMISQKSFELNGLLHADMLIIQFLVIICIWVISSIIPASYYSNLKHTMAGMKKNIFVGKGDHLRKSFVVIQYGISLLLIIGSMILYQQMDFIQNKDLGFDNQNIITWDINSGNARRNQLNIIRELKKSSLISNACASSRVPGEWKSTFNVDFSLDKNMKLGTANHFAVDENWLETYGINLSLGSNFQGNDSADTLKILVNRLAVEKLGFDQPIGETIMISRDDNFYRMQIIGVVDDFHYKSMHEVVAPLVVTSLNNPILGSDYYSIKYHGHVADVISHIENVQSKFDPNSAAELNFLDEKWARYYKADEARSTLILIATCISILISAFGLFGLVSFSVERKTKEIGIRKALGASALGIIKHLLKDYATLLLVALFIATPFAYWLMSTWLDGFAYRIELSPVIFLFAFASVSIISFLTVISRVLKIAQSNPVVSLRSE